MNKNATYFSARGEAGNLTACAMLFYKAVKMRTRSKKYFKRQTHKTTAQVAVYVACTASLVRKKTMPPKCSKK